MKTQLKTILVPVDFSLASKNAIRYVKQVFENERIHLIMSYVTDSIDDLVSINENFSRIRKLELSGTNFLISHNIVEGNPKAELLKLARNVNFVVLGVKEYREISSISDSLLKDLTCSVITVPENFVSHKLNRIAYASDDIQIEYSEVFDHIRFFSQKFDSKVYIFHLYDDSELALNDTSESVLEYYLESTKHDYFTVVDPNILESIQDFIEKHHIDLLTVLTRDHGHNEMNSEGRLVYKLVESVSIPMLILN